MSFSLEKLDCRPSNSLVSFEKKDMLPFSTSFFFVEIKILFGDER